MGILSSEDFFSRSEQLRGVYKEAFRTLVLQAIQGIEASDPENRYLADDFEDSEADSGAKSLSGYSSRNSSFMSGTFEVKPVRSRLETEFRDLDPIGRGGFAQVFQGEHRIDHCKYAFKRIEFKSKTSESYEKIIREIKSLAHLEHPNIVRYHGAWVEEKTLPTKDCTKSTDKIDTVSFRADESGPSEIGISIPIYNDAQQFEMEISLGYYMIIQMELCQFTLADWLEQRNLLICHSNPWKPEYSHKTCRSRIPADFMATLVGANTWDINQTENNRIFKCIVKALQHIHAKGIIHRDLKPGNILFQVDGDSFITKIGDFGLAADMGMPNSVQPSEESTPTRIDSATAGKSPSPSVSRSTRTTGLGTCTYAAPEQIRGDDASYNEKVDIFSLGIILFELYCPFATRMERHNVLEDLKKGIISASFMKRWPKEATFIWSCISESADTRPSAEQIFESEIFEQDSDETIERLSKENSTLRRLLEAEREKVKCLECSLVQSIDKVTQLQDKMIDGASLEIKSLGIGAIVD
jgi:serine/threonine protein kinase